MDVLKYQDKNTIKYGLGQAKSGGAGEVLFIKPRRKTLWL